LSHAQRDLLLRVRGFIARDLAGYGMHADHYGLIHADLVPENLLIDGNRACVIDFDDAALERLPLFLAVRGTTYLGWVHTRQGTDTANEMTPFLIDRACAVAEEYLASR
jgi:serine/threonine protein kinase